MFYVSYLPVRIALRFFVGASTKRFHIEKTHAVANTWYLLWSINLLVVAGNHACSRKPTNSAVISIISTLNIPSAL